MYIIYCRCGEPCGYQYPDIGPTYSSGGEQGYAEGPGEDFTLNGEWFCSQECLDEAKQKEAV